MRTLRFFGSTHSKEVELLVTLGNRTVFNGTITQGQEDFLFEAHNIPLDFSGKIPMAVSVTNGTVTLGRVQINHDRISNPIYNQENLNKFQAAVSWAKKISIMCDVARPTFSQDQIEFLRLEDPDHWVAQEKILNQHGCALTVLDPGSWRDVNLLGDVRQNVTLNGILQTPSRTLGEIGTWSWIISTGDVLCYDLIISATPTFYDMPRENWGAYTLPEITMDFLNQIQLMNELKRPGIKILDIGAGRGEMLQQLRNNNILVTVHGLDTPNKGLHYVLNHTYDEFIEADLRYTLPIADNIYDVVICSNVFLQSVMELENTPPMTADCLDEILRIVPPGGIFICSIDRLCWAEFDCKMHQLTDSDTISILGQIWVYQREKLYMFPPARLCMAVRKH